jgi:hypothetical protein
MLEHLGWSAVLAWTCGLGSAGCLVLAIALSPNPRPRRRSLIDDAGRSRVDDRDSLRRFYNIHRRG